MSDLEDLNRSSREVHDAQCLCGGDKRIHALRMEVPKAGMETPKETIIHLSQSFECHGIHIIESELSELIKKAEEVNILTEHISQLEKEKMKFRYFEEEKISALEEENKILRVAIKHIQSQCGIASVHDALLCILETTKEALAKVKGK